MRVFEVATIVADVVFGIDGRLGWLMQTISRVVLIGAISLLVDIDAANACSCVSSPGLTSFPRHDATGVPINAVVILPFGTDYQMETAGGALIDVGILRFETNDSHAFSVLVPADDLLPNSTYVVMGTVRGPSDDPTLRFSTGDGPLVSTPSAPLIERTRAIAEPPRLRHIW